MNTNMSKKVKLSGFCEATFYVGWNGDEPVDGFIVQIDGKNYGAYVDPDDGYRSYGLFFETEQPCTNTFPPQEVLMEDIKEEGGYDWFEDPKVHMIRLINCDTKETILEAGTVWYDSYYPMGRCYFNPPALPINKEKEEYEGCNLTIIAEWKRHNGQHIIIGKTEDGNYIEGILSEEGIEFGPITQFMCKQDKC